MLLLVYYNIIKTKNNHINNNLLENMLKQCTIVSKKKITPLYKVITTIKNYLPYNLFDYFITLYYYNIVNIDNNDTLTRKIFLSRSNNRSYLLWKSGYVIEKLYINDTYVYPFTSHNYYLELCSKHIYKITPNNCYRFVNIHYINPYSRIKAEIEMNVTYLMILVFGDNENDGKYSHLKNLITDEMINNFLIDRFCEYKENYKHFPTHLIFKPNRKLQKYVDRAAFDCKYELSKYYKDNGLVPSYNAISKIRKKNSSWNKIKELFENLYEEEKNIIINFCWYYYYRNKLKFI